MKGAVICFLLFAQVLYINAQAFKAECETSEDCMSNAECIDNKCQCMQGFVEVKKLFRKVCLPYATVENEFKCEADEQCGLIEDESNPKGNPATCSLLRRVCSCKESSWYPSQEEGNNKNPVCVRGFDSSCDNDNQCQRSIPNAVCQENKCSCPEDFVKMEDENMCLPYATEEENSCVVDEQCSRMHDSFGHLFNKHPKCDNDTQTCMCHKEHFAIFNNTCVRGYGAKCGLLRKCGIEHSKCALTSLTCDCTIGYKPNELNNKCEGRWSCTADMECPENTYCEDNVCKEAEVESELTKSECETDADCMENAQCISNQCECQQGFVEAKQWLKKVCLPYASLDNGLSCDVDEQCSLIQDESNPKGSPATCKLFWKVCACKDSTWFPAEDEQNGPNPICTRGFDSQCETNQQCQRSILDAVCEENKCTCSEDYIKMEDEHMCLPYATDEQNVCIIDEQCSRMHDSKGYLFNKHPTCDNSTSSCVCHADNWVLNNSTCVRGLGARCGLMRKCGIENSKCGLFSRKCECEDGYVPNEETNTCDENPEYFEAQESQKKRSRSNL